MKDPAVVAARRIALQSKKRPKQRKPVRQFVPTGRAVEGKSWRKSAEGKWEEINPKPKVEPKVEPLTFEAIKDVRFCIICDDARDFGSGKCGTCGMEYI